MRDADAVFTLRPYYRRRSGPLKQAEERAIPIYVLRNNTVAQIEQARAQLDARGLVHGPVKVGAMIEVPARPRSGQTWTQSGTTRTPSGQNTETWSTSGRVDSADDGCLRITLTETRQGTTPVTTTVIAKD